MLVKQRGCTVCSDENLCCIAYSVTVKTEEKHGYDNAFKIKELNTE